MPIFFRILKEVARFIAFTILSIALTFFSALVPLRGLDLFHAAGECGIELRGFPLSYTAISSGPDYPNFCWDPNFIQDRIFPFIFDVLFWTFLFYILLYVVRLRRKIIFAQE